MHATLTTGERVPVGKLLCVGRNYADHAREMGATAPAEPFFFLKPATAVVPSGGDIEMPPGIGAVHHEVEISALIGTRARRVAEADALRHVQGYALALDMTARDLQAKAKKEGLPWTLAKGLDTFAPLGEFAPASAVPDPQALTFELAVNGDVRQRGNAQDMVHGVAALIAYASRFITLEPGDVLLTGTPAGVGPVQDGDRLVARAAGLPTLEVGVRAL